MPNILRLVTSKCADCLRQAEFWHEFVRYCSFLISGFPVDAAKVQSLSYYSSCKPNNLRSRAQVLQNKSVLCFCTVKYWQYTASTVLPSDVDYFDIISLSKLCQVAIRMVLKIISQHTHCFQIQRKTILEIEK